MTELEIAGTAIAPGERRPVEIPAGRLVTGTRLSLPVEVLRGTEPGPVVWLNGAIHGDEIIGVEIIRRVMERLAPGSTAGTVISVPIVNLFGFITESRYLPDRRDLNRAFPGSEGGSLAARLAHLFMEEIVRKCEYGIDYHAGSDDRTNLPQIRANLDDQAARRFARAFAAPVTIDARLRDGSLRQAAAEEDVHVLLYEGGEPRRFDREAIGIGVRGTLRALRSLEMCDPEVAEDGETVESRKTRWARAPRSGILELEVERGDHVEKGGLLGRIRDSFGDQKSVLRARIAGLVIGHTVNPLVHRGDGVVHLAEVEGDDGDGTEP